MLFYKLILHPVYLPPYIHSIKYLFIYSFLQVYVSSVYISLSYICFFICISPPYICSLRIHFPLYVYSFMRISPLCESVSMYDPLFV